MSLDIGFSIHAPSGWIELEDPENGYEAHKDTRAEQAITWRKQEIDSAFVEGTYTTEAVRENVTEALVIYVRGTTAYELHTRLTALTDGLGQLRYEIKVRMGNLEQTWDCGVADYTVQTPQEMINATMAVVRASVPRRPTMAIAEV